MPNWCSNELIVKGNKESIDTLLSLIESDELSFDFEKVIPLPEGIKQDSEDGFYFRLNNWGTKWRLEEDSTSIDRWSDENVSIRFDTAWSPCLPIVTRLAEMFPILRFEYTYQEEGMDFSGFATFENGELIDSDGGEDKEDEEDEEDDFEDEEEGSGNTIINKKTINNSYQEEFEKASRTTYFKDYKKYPEYGLAINPVSGNTLKLNPLEMTIYSFCMGWYARYESGVDTEEPTSTYDIMRFYFLSLNPNAYFELLD